MTGDVFGLLISDSTRTIVSSVAVTGPDRDESAYGVIVDGETTVDEALLTGETTPLHRKPGDSLAAGSVNLDGNVEMRVERTGASTTLGTISRLSEQARFARPAFVQLADRIASYIVVALLVVAAAVLAADRALYAAKAGGRDCVEAAGEKG